MRKRLPGPGEWAVYMLLCGDGSLYTGATNDVRARVLRHGAGRGAAYTRSRLPVSLVYWERALDRSAALRREAALKRLRRREKLALVGALRPGASPPARRGSGRSRAASPSP